MNLKISSSSTSSSAADLNSSDPIYNDLMDWAKERKQQFLRNRAKGSLVSSSSNNPESPIKPETEAWIETWYTPPSLPSKNTRQRAVPSEALCQEATDIEEGGVKKVQEKPQSELQASEFKTSPSPQPPLY